MLEKEKLISIYIYLKTLSYFRLSWEFSVVQSYVPEAPLEVFQKVVDWAEMRKRLPAILLSAHGTSC